MTTRRTATLRRERANQWPLFEDIALPDDIGVLSVEMARLPCEKASVPVEGAARILQNAVVRLIPRDRYAVWLVALGPSVRPSQRVAAHNVAKNKVWLAFENSGRAVPEGSRVEQRVDYDNGSFGFAGGVRTVMEALPSALEVTRTENAVCLATGAAVDPLAEIVTSSLDLVDNRPPAVLRLAVQKLPRLLFVARSFGEFDDGTVGVDVLASNALLDRLETAIEV